MGVRYEFGRDQLNRVRPMVQTFPSSVIHVHNSLELMYVEDGELETDLLGSTHAALPGYWIASSSFVAHGYHAKREGRYCCLIVPNEVLHTYSGTRFDQMQFAEPIFRDDSGELLSLFRLIHRLYSSNKDDFDNPETSVGIMAHSMAVTIFELAALKSGLVKKDKSTSLLERAAEYIHGHYAEPLGAAELSKVLFCRQQTLSALFSKAFGMSITAYINRLRVLEADRLIKSENITLEQAAERSGFGSVRTLLRAYQRQFGQKPSERRVPQAPEKD